MRFQKISITNYKGLESLELDDIANESTIMISGRNGTGKSLMLEAIAFAWHGGLSLPERVGPFGDTCEIELTVRLTDDELARARQWSVDEYRPIDGEDERLVRFHRHATRMQDGGTSYDPIVNVLRTTAFRKDNPFAQLDYLPAHRTMNLAAGFIGSVDLGMFYSDRIEDERNSNLQGIVEYNNPLNLPDVSSYLLTLDYQAFVAARQGIDLSDEYDLIARTFNSATGKTLRLPEYSIEQGESRIWVELPNGKRHPLGGLSSGEQEMLGLMYYIRRLSATGGVMCIDEPELHLHPTLQAAAFATMRDLSERAQIFVVSHSASLISTAPISSMVQIAAPTGASDNQIRRLKDESNRRDLISALGVTAANLVQNDLILAVEGPRDEQILSGLFPVELGRSLVLTPGNRDRVLQRFDSLSVLPPGVPWLCVIDRDLLNDDEILDYQTRRPGLFVWECRAIESGFLDVPLLLAVINANRIGTELSADEVEQMLIEAAEPLKDEVLATLVNKRLMRDAPPPTSEAGLNRFAKMRKYNEDYAAVSLRRAEILDDIVREERSTLEGRWATDYVQLADPKAMLGALNTRIGVFRSPDILLNSLVAFARDNPTQRPQSIQKFGAELIRLLQG